MKGQINFRASSLTRAQIEKLAEVTGLNQTGIIAIAIDRMAREEMMSNDAMHYHLMKCHICGRAYNSGMGNIHLCYPHELAEMEQSPAVIAHAEWVIAFEKRHPNWPNRVAWDTD